MPSQLGAVPQRRRHDSADGHSSTRVDKEDKDETSQLEEPRSKSKMHRMCVQQQLAWQRRIPCLSPVFACYQRLPPRVRMAFIMSWILWKIFFTLVLLRIVLVARMSKGGGLINPPDQLIHVPKTRTRLLYVVTGLSEFNTGQRNTKAGQDRLGEVVLPILVDSVESMVSPPFNYHVDVYLVLGYTLREERRREIANRLPKGVGLEVWDDALPMGYSKEHGREKVKASTRTLARQHRFVIKDKLQYYDIFAAFEDDMRITGAHVDHFMTMSAELERLKNEAPKELKGLVPENMDPYKMRFHGPMTQRQMKRLIPGFVRVEVLLDEKKNGAQTKLAPIPVDFDFPVERSENSQVTLEEQHIDPVICCHVPNMKPNIGTPKEPYASDVVIWETAIKGLSVRHFANSSLFDWTVMLPGPGKRLKAEDHMGGYWSGRNGAFGDEKKPTPGMPDLIAQQGGWMATREQIIQLNEECMGSFLPPFDQPIYNEDGHQSMNVEFWSGGYQFFTGVRGGCNMQRLVSLKPEHFSKHLIYHVANNKQRQLSRERMVKADNLFGQLNAVKKVAEKAMRSEESQ